MDKNKTILVTGCAGLLGSHLSSHLLHNGYQVIGIDDLSGGYLDWVPQGADMHFVEMNLTDGARLMDLYDQFRPMATFHFAAYAAEGLSPFIRRFNYENNLVASAAVINACIAYDSKMIFSSSMAVYGDQDPPFREAMQISPVDPYGIAKAAVELDLAIAGQQHGLRWSVVRPHNVIGTRQNIWDKYRNVLGIFIRRVLAGEPILIFGDGSQMRAFSHIKFMLEPFANLIDNHDGRIFNIGSDRPTTVRHLAEMVASAARERGYPVTIQHEPARHEVLFAYSDHERAREELGYLDNTDLPGTVREVFDWALTEPERPVREMAYEITRDLYPSWR